MNEPCKKCGRKTTVARKYYTIAGERRFHLGDYCAHCKKFQLPWYPQTKQNVKAKSVKSEKGDGLIQLSELINPTLLDQ